MPHPTRRSFLRLAGGSLLLPFAGCVSPSPRSAPYRLGMIADLHHGLEPTAQRRIEEFIAEAQSREVDGIVQLGDFNYGTPESRPCMNAWNAFQGDSIHVLGNHDMDKVTKPVVQECWDMAAPYSSFDRGGFHFVVLDRNNLRTEDGDVPYAEGNYFAHPRQRGYADRAQLEWLRADLAATELPTVVFVHQGLGMRDGLPPGDPRAEIEAILDEANRDRQRPKVVACFCGHEHLDRHRLSRGIHYVWINSASYYWVGSDYGRMASYRDALYAFVTFDPRGRIVIEGRQSDWVAPTPADRGFPHADEVTASISDRDLVI